MNRHTNAIPTDLDLLKRLKSLSFLSAVELGELARSLHSVNFYRRRSHFFRRGAGGQVSTSSSLGVAKITCLNRT
jgi:hypothetical protein